jgi:hypothetical protein
MTTRAAVPKTTNQSLMAIKKKRFAMAAVVETADRLAPPEQCVTDRFLHSFARRVAHSSRALLLAVAVPHDCFQGFSIALGDQCYVIVSSREIGKAGTGDCRRSVKLTQRLFGRRGLSGGSLTLHDNSGFSGVIPVPPVRDGPSSLMT